MNIINQKETPYFERLPRFTMPALQAAWDKAKDRKFGAQAIYTAFCCDMDFVGYEQPSKPVMNQWIDGVQKGEILRPGSTAEDLKDFVAEAVKQDDSANAHPRSKGKAEAQHHSRQDFLSPKTDVTFAVEPELAKSFFSPELPADVVPIEPMAKDLRAISAKMLDQLVAEFEANARRHATSLVVSILRDLAAEMERAA